MPIVVAHDDPRIVAGLAGSAGLYATNRTNTADSLQQQQLQQEMRLRQQNSDLQFADLVNRNRNAMDSLQLDRDRFVANQDLARDQFDAQQRQWDQANQIAWDRNAIAETRPTSYDTELARQQYKSQQAEQKQQDALDWAKGDPAIQRLVAAGMTPEKALEYTRRVASDQSNSGYRDRSLEQRDQEFQRKIDEMNRRDADRDASRQLSELNTLKAVRASIVSANMGIAPSEGEEGYEQFKKLSEEIARRADAVSKQAASQPTGAAPATQPSSGQLPPPDAMAGQLPVYEDPAKIDALPAGTVFITRINGRLARVVKE